MHDLPYPCPSESLLDWAILDGVVLDHRTVVNLFLFLSQFKGGILIVLIGILLRFNVVIDVTEDVVGSLAN